MEAAGAGLEKVNGECLGEISLLPWKGHVPEVSSNVYVQALAETPLSSILLPFLGQDRSTKDKDNMH